MGFFTFVGPLLTGVSCEEIEKENILPSLTPYSTYRGFRNSVTSEPQDFVETPQTPISLESFSNEDSKFMWCVESSLSVGCILERLENDGLSPFSARAKRPRAAEMSLSIDVRRVF